MYGSKLMPIGGAATGAGGMAAAGFPVWAWAGVAAIVLALLLIAYLRLIPARS